MPEAFDKCNKGGGKVRTVTKGPNKNRLICLPKGAAHPVLGKRRGHRGRGKRGG